MTIAGVYPPIPTPFDAQGRLHASALAANIERWEQTGLHGYVVAGSNGESPLLEVDEIAKAVRIVRQTAAPDKRVIAGTGCQSTAATLRLTQAVAEAGAALALIMTPSFYPGQMTPAALMRHYTTVADGSPIPVLIYNVPKFTNLNLDPAVAAQLAAHPNIVGIKDSAGNIGQIIELLRLCPPDFDVLMGNAPAFFSGLQVGAVGGILALANVAPAECVAIWRLVRQGRDAQAREIQFRLMALGRAVTAGYGVPGLKAALDQLGYYGGPPRPPLLPADESARETIHRVLVEAQVLD